MNHPSKPVPPVRAASAACIALLLLALTAPLRADGTNHYLPEGLPDAAVILAPPPLPDSAEQAADMAAVVAVFHASTSNQAALAFSEKKFSIFNFAPAIGAFFQPGKFPQTEAFFQRVQKDAETVADRAKTYWKRPRPFMVDPSLASGTLETTFSYPSGHSTEGSVLALVLADLFPERRDDILDVGRNLGWHKLWIARHYPTDIYAGRVLAQFIVREMKIDPEFQKDFANVKSEIAAAQDVDDASTITPSPVAARH